MDGHEFCGEFVYPAGGCHREPGHTQRHSVRGDVMTVWRSRSGRLHRRVSCSGGTTGAEMARVTYREYLDAGHCPCIERSGWKADWQRSGQDLMHARRSR